MSLQKQNVYIDFVKFFSLHTLQSSPSQNILYLLTLEHYFVHNLLVYSLPI